jgi:hypothetical protein
MMGLPISVDSCFSVVLVAGLFGVDGDVSCPFFLSNLQIELLLDYQVDLIMQYPLSASKLQFSLDPPEYPVRWNFLPPNPEVVASCVDGGVIGSPYNTLGKLFLLCLCKL